jgi:hypothetical protein
MKFFGITLLAAFMATGVLATVGDGKFSLQYGTIRKTANIVVDCSVYGSQDCGTNEHCDSNNKCAASSSYARVHAPKPHVNMMRGARGARVH